MLGYCLAISACLWVLIGLCWTPNRSEASSQHKVPSISCNAGCLVKKDGLLLAVKTVKSGKWDIPSGKPEGNETSAQTAMRETLEETGIKVKAVRLLEDFEDEFHLYECHIEELSAQSLQNPLNVPSSALHEIEEVALIDIHTLTSANTRFPSILPRIKSLFKTLS